MRAGHGYSRRLAPQGLLDYRKQLPTVPGLGEEISNSYRPKFPGGHSKHERAGEHDRQSRFDFQEFCRQLDSIEEPDICRSVMTKSIRSGSSASSDNAQFVWLRLGLSRDWLEMRHWFDGRLRRLCSAWNAWVRSSASP
jgi:hypothetical protein